MVLFFLQSILISRLSGLLFLVLPTGCSTFSGKYGSGKKLNNLAIAKFKMIPTNRVSPIRQSTLFNIDTKGHNKVHELVLAKNLKEIDLFFATGGLTEPERSQLLNAQDFSGASPLHLAVQAGHVEIVNAFTENAIILPDLQDCKGATPLHLAAQAGHIEIIKILVKTTKLSLYVKDYANCTPVDLATQRGHKEVIKVLVQAADAARPKEIILTDPVFV